MNILGRKFNKIQLHTPIHLKDFGNTQSVLDLVDTMKGKSGEAVYTKIEGGILLSFSFIPQGKKERVTIEGYVPDSNVQSATLIPLEKE